MSNITRAQQLWLDRLAGLMLEINGNGSCVTCGKPVSSPVRCCSEECHIEYLHREHTECERQARLEEWAASPRDGNWERLSELSD